VSDPHRAHCQGCGRHRTVVGGISWSGLCRDCAIRAVDENLEALETRSGYNYTRWLRGMARFLDRATLDAEPAGAHTSSRDA
jgi:hypothetical protein